MSRGEWGEAPELGKDRGSPGFTPCWKALCRGGSSSGRPRGSRRPQLRTNSCVLGHLPLLAPRPSGLASPHMGSLSWPVLEEAPKSQMEAAAGRAPGPGEMSPRPCFGFCKHHHPCSLGGQGPAPASDQAVPSTHPSPSKSKCLEFHRIPTAEETKAS